MNLSSIKRESFIGSVLRFPLRLIPPGLVMRIAQGPLRGKRWIAGSGNHGCWLGSYEYDKQRTFRNYLHAGDVVYDLGANVGFYSLLAADAVGPAGRVFSFEPFADNLAYLRRHMELNKIANCRIFDAAVSSKDGQASFAAGCSPSEGRLAQPAQGTVTVRTVALDTLALTKLIDPPNVIKCDIEGGEYDALLGMAQTLKGHQPVIFMATHGREIHARCCELLTALGYQLRSLDGSGLQETDELIAVPRSSADCS